jgi:hypothetical protein
MKEYAFLLFFCELPQTILGYMGYRAVAMQAFVTDKPNTCIATA